MLGLGRAFCDVVIVPGVGFWGRSAYRCCVGVESDSRCERSCLKR